MTDNTTPENTTPETPDQEHNQQLLPLTPCEQTSEQPTPEQVQQVYQWVIEGKSQDDIEFSIREHWPQADGTSIALAVTTRLIEASDFTPEVVRGMAIEATREVYKRALETADLQVALRAIRQLWEMTSTVKL